MGDPHLTEFDGNLVSVARARWTWARWKTKAKKASQKASEEAMKPLVDALSDTLKDTVKGSARHPPPDRIACLPGGGRIAMSNHLQRMLKAAGQDVPVSADSGNQPGTPAGEKLDASQPGHPLCRPGPHRV